ncbi:ribonuclease H-like domain-containing protein [Biscogniauxia mediterranea]|nr:ribonuclease H-like domain-containing protein [Biscogniauxia mediterranea]
MSGRGNRGGSRGRGSSGPGGPSGRGGSSGRGRGGGDGGGRGGGGGGFFQQGGRGGRGGGYGGGGYGGPSGPLIFTSPGGIPPPDDKVTRIEDALQKSLSGATLEALSLVDKFPSRPSYGTKGTSIVVWANYFALDASPKLVLQRYDVSVKPEAVGKKLVQIIRLLLQTPELLPYKADLVTDFKSTLISRQKLEDQTIDVTYRGDDEDEPSARAQQYKVKLQFTNVLSVSQLTDYLNSTDASARYDDKLPMIQALNVFLNHYAKSSKNVATIGASKTFSLDDSPETYNLTNCLVAVRGFFSSVRAATARVLVNVNVSHSAFYQEGPLDQFILGHSSQRNPFRLQKFLKGVKVKRTHLKERKNKSGKVIIQPKTIQGLANKNDGSKKDHPPIVKAFGAGPKDVQFWIDEKPSSSSEAPSTSTPAGKKKRGKGSGPAPAGKAATAGGRYISVYDFFATTHGVRIQNPELPVVNIGTKDDPSYLPPQVCYVLPGPANKQLDPTQTQNMIRFAVRRPVENATSIVMKGRQTAGLSPDTNPLLGQFGITVSNKLITTPARVLVGPRVVYKQNQSAQVMAGSWNMVPRNSPSLKFNTGTNLQKWSCLYINMPNDHPRAQSFTPESLKELMGKFHTVLRDTGMAVAPPLPPQPVSLRDTDDPNLDDLFKRAAASLQLLFIILPATPIPLYYRIKQLGDVKYGIHTICSVGTKIAKPQGQDQYFRNEALKANLKLGGNNQAINPINLGLVAENKTMVVGIDVTHPSPGSSSLAPSVAAMVASIDNLLGQWPGVLSLQKESRQEMVTDLKDMLKSRLSLWRGKHPTLPESILVYRDGVSEGQYQKVLDEELPLLRAACQEMYPPPDQKKGLPRLTIVVVSKRHHTRFYPTSEADADRSGNTKSGTVVDRGVTEARSWDFFLQAHTALQGTARPTHYFVLLDEIFRPRYGASGKKPATKNIADELQELTQSLCYVFGRATKAVSYCTPAYYADILCERSRGYLNHLFEEGSGSGSVAGSSVAGGSGSKLAGMDDIKIHDRLKNTMFYI